MFKDTVFHRLFSITMYKDKQIPMGQMSFDKDFINDKRGDLYPLFYKSSDCDEQIHNGKYVVSQGEVCRFICRFFPFATYQVDYTDFNGQVGFEFNINCSKVRITIENNKIVCKEDGKISSADCERSESLIVSCRPSAFDIFLKNQNNIKFIHTFEVDSFADSNDYKLFSTGSASLYISGDVIIHGVYSYIDCGISQADMRPIRYENGDIMVDKGKIYLTMSIRMQKNMFQGIFSWVPGTADFDLTGALFYDSGDGKWCGDVAASVLYNRSDNKWYLWVASFNHGHILGHSKFDADIRFGVNVVDITLMDKIEGSAYTDFAAASHDEDPDFYYDKEKDKWYMAICRKDPEIKSYRYVFFESDSPFAGYKYIGCGKDGAETGGSFVKIKDDRYFICGNDFNLVSNYRIYSKNGMENAKFDHPDGGFRGWGTLMPIKLGSRTRYFWLTFDRHNGSDFNWSYGNIYCFEGEI